MASLQERIANERRRLRHVRLQMIAAIEEGAKGDKSFVDFYIAAADYIDTTMQRLHDQDVKMGDMIKKKAAADDNRVEGVLQNLKERLDGARAHLKPFLASRDKLRTNGAGELENFERVGREYSDFIVANMGHNDTTTELMRTLFTGEDWEYMAGISDEQQRQDKELYERVVAATPDSVPHISQ